MNTAAIAHKNLFAGRRRLARSFQKASPFRHVVIDGFLKEAYCRRLSGEFLEYDPVRFRNEHGHLGKATHEDIRSLGPSFRKLDDFLGSAEFLKFLGDVTGIPGLIFDPTYFGGGTHENLPDMELDPHVDFTVHPKTGLYRRVNMLLYLNFKWDEEWGGNLELHTNPWLHSADNKIKKIPPLFNRCVLFETHDHSWHGFETIKKPALSRRSVAVYFYTNEAAPNFAPIPSDLTVFVDRPLPAHLVEGRRLTGEDMRLLQRLIVRRDWKLKYLYDRAIALSNELKLSETKRELMREALVEKNQK